MELVFLTGRVHHQRPVDHHVLKSRRQICGIVVLAKLCRTLVIVHAELRVVVLRRCRPNVNVHVRHEADVHGVARLNVVRGQITDVLVRKQR